MDAVRLDGARNVNKVFVDHGNEGDAGTGGRLPKDLIEGVNVIGAVVRRKRNAAQQHTDVRMQQSGEHDVEILPGGRERQSAQTIVAAELDDDHGGMQAQNSRQALHGILGGGAAGAKVHNLIAVAELVEITAQCIRVRLSGGQPVAGGDTVSKADEGGFALRMRRSGQQDSEEGNNKCAANVHRNSVCA